MTRQVAIIGLLCATFGVASASNAQDTPQKVRITSVDANGEHRWQGYVARLTPDSVYLRIGGADSIAAIPRKWIHTYERERPARPARAAGIGCLSVAGAIGALGFLGAKGSSDPGPGYMITMIASGVGCGLGALGGLVVSAARVNEWSTWEIP
jgi:hypothetical protein